MISKIQIFNFKSIEKMILEIDNKKNLICFLGKNGAGKSNVFKAIRFFFDNLCRDHSDDIMIDKLNPYVQECVISIKFNIHLLSKKAEYNTKLKAEFARLSMYLRSSGSKNTDELELVMRQSKDGSISWSVSDRNIRSLIKTAFPLYYIDTRNLDLLSWNKLWDIINDLSASIPRVTAEEYTDLLDKTFEEIYGKKYADSKDILISVFNENHISLDKYHFDNKQMNAFSMRFGGERFLVDEKDLGFYSDGTSSYKYLLLLVSLIPKISDLGCKFPIIVVDEPKIGLHNSFIADFVASVCKNIKNNALLFISTHSPQIISELSMNDAMYDLYRVYSYRLHSVLKKMNLSWIHNGSVTVTVKETECYFSDALVYVEGESEMQLFRNKHLRSLFSNLSKLHFYSFDGNEARLEKAHSGVLNLGVEYKVIVDIDKIITYKGSGKFGLSNDNFINPLKNSVGEVFRYYSGNSGNDPNELKNNINLLLQKNFNISPGTHYFNDKNYELLINGIKDYCLLHNTVVNRTTIEGELITCENIDKFLKFIELQRLNKGEKEQHSNIALIPDIREKTVNVICECCGRSELANSAGLTYKRILGKKTDGWITNWLDYYFDIYISPLESEAERRLRFRSDFPSLNNTLQILNNMV